MSVELRQRRETSPIVALHTSPEHASLQGVRLLRGGYLLLAPLSLGAEWTGPVGRVHVSGVDQSVDVSAGHFEGCLETTEVGGASKADVFQSTGGREGGKAFLEFAVTRGLYVDGVCVGRRP